MVIPKAHGAFQPRLGRLCCCFLILQALLVRGKRCKRVGRVIGGQDEPRRRGAFAFAFASASWFSDDLCGGLGASCYLMLPF